MRTGLQIGALSSGILSGSLLVDQLIEGSSVHLLSKHKFCLFILHLKMVLLVHRLLHQSSGCCFPYEVCCISQFSSLRSNLLSFTAAAITSFVSSVSHLVSLELRQLVHYIGVYSGPLPSRYPIG